MNTSVKIILVTSLVGTLGIGVLAPNIYPIQSPTNAQVKQENDSDAEENGEEAQEAAQLQSLTKITLQQAQQAAETAAGGKASSIELENEDGNLVYEVTVGQQEVIVDAGNGQVLYTEDINQEDDKDDASHPKSSIQVPDSD